jgi:hypothetical protein
MGLILPSRNIRRSIMAVISAIAILVVGDCAAKSQGPPVAASRPLLKLAEAQFQDLTRAEISLLVHSDLQSLEVDDFAAGGTSAVPSDSSNDPTGADKWPRDRSVRAELIRWMCVDPRAVALIDPRGIRLTGARIESKLDLSHVRIPFGIALVRCSIPEILDLTSADVATLDLNGSRTDRINAEQLHVRGEADFGWDNHWWGTPFEPTGELDLSDSRIDGSAVFGTGVFHASKNPAYTLSPEAAIDLSDSTIGSDVNLCCGMVAHGMVDIDRINVSGSINLSGAHFENAGAVAVTGISARSGHDIYLTTLPVYGDFQADGLVQFLAAHAGGLIWVNHAHFKGSDGSPNGLVLGSASMRILGWQKVELQKNAKLDLGSASADVMVDDEQSWPARGNLILDNFTYQSVGPISDAALRLQWLGRQPPGFHPQPYRELAKFLREAGDESGALKVLVAGDDARYSQLGGLGAVWGWFLKWTIGYGHRPLLTVFWAALVVTIGFLVVRAAANAGVMRPTYPENRPGDDSRYEVLHPLLYSLDVFLPFVNLHQEHYWWPDAQASGRCSALGVPAKLTGALVLYYLWAQIIAGWLLSAIFIAGVTGLLRND